MNLRNVRCLVAGLAVCLASDNRGCAEPSQADRDLMAAVAAKCFAQANPEADSVEGYDQAFVLAKPGPNWAWPPLVAISADEEVNANARITFVQPGEKPILEDEPNVVWIDVPGFEPQVLTGDADAANGTPPRSSDQPEGTVIQPVLCFKQGYLDKIIRGQEGPLAGTFGHELAHILLGHTLGGPSGPALIKYADSRQREANADELGMELALRAKFDYDAMVAGARLERDEGYRCSTGLRKSGGSFVGMKSTHPGWNDRLALIDQRQRDMWRSADAFENGVYFLMTEQYPAANRCFEEVIKKYPQCYEAWANKGYGELMMFCDGLEPDDLRQFDIGQLVVGGFYPRPQSLTRGVDEDLWFLAVGDLRQALLLKPDLIMAKANLAVAWLVRPAGKETGKAEKLFQEVFEALKQGHYDEEIEPLVRASLLINAGVAENAHGDPVAAEAFFEEAREIIASTSQQAQGGALSNAIRFNRARMLASRSEPAPRKSAIEEFEGYLASSSPAATWWELAFEEYEKLCAKESVEPKAREELAQSRNNRFRPVIGVALADGRLVTLNQSVGELAKSIGEGQRQAVVKGTTIHRRRYADLGLDLLCTDKVLAIRLQGAKAPPLVLKAAGLSQETRELRPGMNAAELDELLGGDATQCVPRYGTSSAIIYNFYYRLGFGVRLTDEKKVMEIIVAQIPEAAGVD